MKIQDDETKEGEDGDGDEEEEGVRATLEGGFCWGVGRIHLIPTSLAMINQLIMMGASVISVDNQQTEERHSIV